MPKTISPAKERQIRRKVAENILKRATDAALKANRVMTEAKQRVRDAEIDYQIAIDNWLEADRQLDLVKRDCAASLCSI